MATVSAAARMAKITMAIIIFMSAICLGEADTAGVAFSLRNHITPVVYQRLGPRAAPLARPINRGIVENPNISVQHCPIINIICGSVISIIGTYKGSR